MRYVGAISSKAYEVLAYSGDWWQGLTFREQTIIVAGGGLTGACMLLGSPQLVTAAIAALASNIMLWLLIEDSPGASRFMRRFGDKLDGVLTVGGIGLGFLGGTVTGGLFGALFGSGFTACRTFAKTAAEFNGFAANDDNEEIIIDVLPLGAAA